jgi:hypothetical protein
MKSAEASLLPLQRKQQEHDERAHRDILNLDTHTRLKHMVLHFLKYAGKIASAREKGDVEAFKSALVDTFIICMATANALNVSLGQQIAQEADGIDHLASLLSKEIASATIFDTALVKLTVIAGGMAKAIESTDHLELGNPRAQMEDLIVQLSRAILGVIGTQRLHLEDAIDGRWKAVEAKSIFARRTSV